MKLKAVAVGILLGTFFTAQAETIVLKDEVTNIKIAVRGSLSCTIGDGFSGYVPIKRGFVELKADKMEDTVFSHGLFINWARPFGSVVLSCLPINAIINEADVNGESSVQKRVVVRLHKHTNSKGVENRYISESVTLVFPNKVEVNSYLSGKLENN